MTLRKAELKDLTDIENIEKQCFTHPWSRALINQTLENENTVFIAAENDNKICGYCSADIVADEAYINNIAVSEAYRRQGIAKQLLSYFINFCTENNFALITLEVRKSNLPAISLYKKFGFEEVGCRKNYYSNPKEDCIIMTKYFNNSEI